MAFSTPNFHPEFPPNVPLLSTERLSLDKLLSNDDEEKQRLFRICRSTGMFVLDLSDTKQGRHLMQSVDEIFQLSEVIFALGLEEKQRYSMLNGTVLGCVDKGTGYGTDLKYTQVQRSRSSPRRCKGNTRPLRVLVHEQERRSRDRSHAISPWHSHRASRAICSFCKKLS